MDTDQKQPEQMKAANGCSRPPHFPPHCGCPAG